MKHDHTQRLSFHPYPIQISWRMKAPHHIEFQEPPYHTWSSTKIYTHILFESALHTDFWLALKWKHLLLIVDNLILQGIILYSIMYKYYSNVNLHTKFFKVVQLSKPSRTPQKAYFYFIVINTHSIITSTNFISKISWIPLAEQKQPEYSSVGLCIHSQKPQEQVNINFYHLQPRLFNALLRLPRFAAKTNL